MQVVLVEEIKFQCMNSLLSNPSQESLMEATEIPKIVQRGLDTGKRVLGTHMPGAPSPTITNHVRIRHTHIFREYRAFSTDDVMLPH